MWVDFAEQVAGVEVGHDAHVGQSIDIRLRQQTPVRHRLQQADIVRAGEIVNELRQGRVQLEALRARLTAKTVGRPEYRDGNGAYDDERH